VLLIARDRREVEMAFRILVADDHIDDRTDDIHELPAMLRAAGYEVIATADGEVAYDLVWEHHPDLVVLDIVFDNCSVDGIDILQAIRMNNPAIPVILITYHLTETDDVLRGFKAGADDYVTRPRDNREIVARVRANLPPEVVVIDDYMRVDLYSRRVELCPDGKWQEVHLTRLQFELLEVLILNAGQVALTTTIKERVWGKPVSDGLLAVYVHRLRKALEPDPGNPIYIETVREIGYRFNGRPIHASSASSECRGGCC
jgi:DNA-binding response OmpR family regulator